MAIPRRRLRSWWCAGRHGRRAPWLALALCLLSSSSGCSGCFKKVPPPNPCAGEAAARFELRSESGAVVLQLRAAPADPNARKPDAREVLCDGDKHLVGRLERGERGMDWALRDATGSAVASISDDANGAKRLTAAGSTGFRVQDQGDLVTVFDGSGAPVGQVGRQSGRGIGFAPGGRPLATAERQAPDRLSLRAPGGNTTHTLSGVRDERAAAAFTLEAVPLAGRFLLARMLDHE